MKKKAKEMAKKIVDEMTMVGLQRREEGNQCALIAVDLVLKTDLYSQDRDLWIEVRNQIEKL